MNKVVTESDIEEAKKYRYVAKDVHGLRVVDTIEQAIRFDIGGDVSIMSAESYRFFVNEVLLDDKDSDNNYLVRILSDSFNSVIVWRTRDVNSEIHITEVKGQSRIRRVVSVLSLLVLHVRDYRSTFCVDDDLTPLNQALTIQFDRKGVRQQVTSVVKSPHVVMNHIDNPITVTHDSLHDLLNHSEFAALTKLLIYSDNSKKQNATNRLSNAALRIYEAAHVLIGDIQIVMVVTALEILLKGANDDDRTRYVALAKKLRQLVGKSIYDTYFVTKIPKVNGTDEFITILDYRHKIVHESTDEINRHIAKNAIILGVQALLKYAALVDKLPSVKEIEIYLQFWDMLSWLNEKPEHKNLISNSKHQIERWLTVKTSEVSDSHYTIATFLNYYYIIGDSRRKSDGELRSGIAFAVDILSVYTKLSLEKSYSVFTSIMLDPVNIFFCYQDFQNYYDSTFDDIIDNRNMHYEHVCNYMREYHPIQTT
ncbi:MAG: hypothetical protein JNL32_02300 [Candidatus Kapabacteria bacterium]|nr:hypothetical protein [Candidatus Kapabacteria bacterium]